MRSCMCTARPDEPRKPKGRVQEHFAKCHPNRCPDKSNKEGKSKHHTRRVNQRASIQRLQHPSGIMDRLSFKLNKTCEVTKPENNDCSQDSSQLSSPTNRGKKSRSSCHHERSYQLSTLRIKTNGNDRRDRSTDYAIIEEQHATEQCNQQCHEVWKKRWVSLHFHFNGLFLFAVSPKTST